jgi:hypothetical protein
MLTCTPKSSDQNTIYFGFRVKPKIINLVRIMYLPWLQLDCCFHGSVSTIASFRLQFLWANTTYPTKLIVLVHCSLNVKHWFLIHLLNMHIKRHTVLLTLHACEMSRRIHDVSWHITVIDMLKPFIVIDSNIYIIL